MPESAPVQRPKVMGVLNATPDSFYAASRAGHLAHAQQRVLQMLQEGADLIDVGAESSRPFAAPIDAEEEWDRLKLILAWLQQERIPFSVDTYKPEIMTRALSYGPCLINDICAFQRPGALEAVQQAGVDLCLMHMQGEPQSMQNAPVYESVVSEVGEFFARRLAACQTAGIALERIILDPGIGFGKTLEHNLLLLRQLATFKSFGCRLLVGVSRKTFIGELLNKPAEERLFGGLGATLAAVLHGADIIRTHDVGATHDALRLFNTCRGDYAFA